jgi:hypothetical protein
MLAASFVPVASLFPPLPNPLKQASIPSSGNFLWLKNNHPMVDIRPLNG